MSDQLLHIISEAEWAEARSAGSITPGSLETEGFVHLSRSDQVLTPANALYRGQTDLLLLVVDTAALDAEVVWEDTYDHGQLFPHVYAPIPATAVTDAVPFPCNHDGAFELPSSLA